MFNFTIISKKSFLSFLNNVNSLLISFLNNLKLSNLKRLTKLFFIDKRVIITLIIIFFSVFVHLSTPAFYKDSWVKETIKNRFEKEFNFDIAFSDKLNYSIFPVPHFHFKDVKFISQDKDLADIKSLKIYLTFKKFFDKNKMNIQKTVIKEAKLNFYKKDINNLVNFFDKKINDKEITISDSKIFFNNEKDEIFSIISISKSKSFFDKKDLVNQLVVDGEIFNNPFKLDLTNNFFKKNLYFDFDLKKLNKKFTNNLDFSNTPKVGLLSFFGSRKRHNTKYEFNKDTFKFYSEEKTKNKFLYKGDINFSPFSSDTQINVKNISLANLFNNDSFLLDILKSDIFFNKNLNFYIQVNSKNVLDHRKLKNLRLNINYENEILNFNESTLLLDDILLVRLLNSEFKSFKNRHFFIGEFEFLINNHVNLYKFFQTSKVDRKKIKTINAVIKYDFLKNDLQIARITIDKKTSENMKNVIEEFNKENKKFGNRIDLRNFFNYLVKGL